MATFQVRNHPVMCTVVSAVSALVLPSRRSDVGVRNDVGAEVITMPYNCVQMDSSLRSRTRLFTSKAGLLKKKDLLMTQELSSQPQNLACVAKTSIATIGSVVSKKF